MLSHLANPARFMRISGVALPWLGGISLVVLALGLVLYAVFHRGAREARRAGDAADAAEGSGGDPPPVGVADEVLDLAAPPARTRRRERPDRAPAGRFDAGGPA